MKKSKAKVKHICGQCDQIFSTEGAYLKHVCPASEKKILAAVRTARGVKKQYNA